MKKLIPLPKVFIDNNFNTGIFSSLQIRIDEEINDELYIKELLEIKMWNYKDIKLIFNKKINGHYNITIKNTLNIPKKANQKHFVDQGYSMNVNKDLCEICFSSRAGLVNAISTLKGLLTKKENGYTLTCCEIQDWPTIEQRSISNTFAWYAGYGRLGFDMQLWGYDEWVEYLNICSDFKINQFNMCMYGYWPFEFNEYHETELRDYPIKVWNKESNNWIIVNYLHPNLSDAFLGKLIEYGHKLCITFFAYVGLNSYSGGYASEHKEKRMKMPNNCKYINDFDRLCLSDLDCLEYLKRATRKIVQLGYDGIDFEESEEAFWYCDCDKCKENFLKPGKTPEEAKHIANDKLFNMLYQEIKKENPDCIVGIRAWRQPPLEKTEKVLKSMVNSVPKDVQIFWTPGLYVPEDEFVKWTEAFGKERIWARDTESNAVSSCFGRLIRIFRSNGLRCDEESNDQYLEEDIRQHIGSVKLGVKGINGYMFEWYGFFIHLFAHAFYGWGSEMEEEAFYNYSIEAVFGEELKEDILYVLKNMFTIHESQLKIFPTEFPFARNKVEKKDLPRIEQAIIDWPIIMEKLKRIKATICKNEKLKIYEPHFNKLIITNQRNRVIYDLAIASVNYDYAVTESDKTKHLKEMYKFNEMDFDIIKNNYFDVNPVDKTGTKSCMIPYHELKRVITNELDPENIDNETIYLGVEALGWLWL